MAGGDVEILFVSEERPHEESTLIERILSERGVTMKAATSYKEAIEELARGKHPIVVLYNFEGSDDLKTTETIRIMKQIVPDLLIVAITDEVPLETERELRKAGLYYYLTRPFGEQELKDVLMGAVGKRLNGRME